jgi:hypothetical protein
MIPVFLRVQTINPTKVKITVLDERVSADLAQETLPDIPPPVHEPKELFSFYCDPLTLAEQLLYQRVEHERVSAQVDPE